MTERLFQRDSYLKTFDARVTAVRPEGVRLDRTAFFPTGGGVLGDTGPLTGPSRPSRRVAILAGGGGVVPTLQRHRPHGESALARRADVGPRDPPRGSP